MRVWVCCCVCACIVRVNRACVMRVCVVCDANEHACEEVCVLSSVWCVQRLVVPALRDVCECAECLGEKEGVLCRRGEGVQARGMYVEHAFNVWCMLNMPLKCSV
jgi:hypothetical protein